jgi:hypothetical protein
MFILTKLTALLPPRLRPYAKSLYPAVATVVAVGVQLVQTGTLDTNALKTAAAGAVLALLSYGVPNGG